MSDFKVGDRVTCINNEGLERALAVGVSYEVTGLLPGGRVQLGSDTGGYDPTRFALADLRDGIRPNYYRVKLEDGTEVECREVMKALGLYENFDLGSAFKYLWRAGKKHADIAEDLEKAATQIKLAAADLEKAKS